MYRYRSTSQEGDKDKWPTKVSASERSKRTAENPRKKRPRKKPQAQAIADETAHPTPKHHEGDSQGRIQT
ncbi:hypothetical protein TSUD_216360 [Trifolium subterraneum]|uniref:Uncharacterized protein n=1 Tax=Trifolium subterraneum TaxID=3900 RepID=A0A2Z6N926_TRISU|nr:hypothetical protein TSUD_216360 [Trifolium subterraneum]